VLAPSVAGLVERETGRSFRRRTRADAGTTLGIDVMVWSRTVAISLKF
jgi:hypothetical protein